MTDRIVSAERVRQLFHYDPDTGHLTRLIRTSNYKSIGARVGSLHHEGYLTVQIEYRKYQLHRIVWLWVYGRWPENQIDHINSVRTDNRLFNLREATNAQNVQNQRKAHKNTTSGYLGVTWHVRSKKWHARITVSGTIYHLGEFDTAEDAHAEYLKAKAAHHPFSTIGPLDDKKYTLPPIRVKSSQYPGVSWHKRHSKWSSYATTNGQRRHLGYHQTEELAYQAIATAMLAREEE